MISDYLFAFFFSLLTDSQHGKLEFRTSALKELNHKVPGMSAADNNVCDFFNDVLGK